MSNGNVVWTVGEGGLNGPPPREESSSNPRTR